MFSFFRRREVAVAAEVATRDTGVGPAERSGLLSIDVEQGIAPTVDVHARMKPFLEKMPGVRAMGGKSGEAVVTMDSTDPACGDSGLDGAISDYMEGQPALGEELYMWFARQGFIGHQLAAMVAQHWLVSKICFMPGRDALRKGWELRNAMGKALPDSVQLKLREADIEFKTEESLKNYIGMGRVFGIRVAIPDIDYEGMDTPVEEILAAPFNIDGVRKDKFKGWIMVDPYWIAPELDAKASAKPNSRHFYTPTWWLINGQRYHRSHLQIFINGHLADILKPAYLYGGIPVPQMIMERIYGAERTANEAPLLAMTKRTVVYKTDLAKATANFSAFMSRVASWSKLWTNTGIRAIDRIEDDHQQFDTSLMDLDAVIMTQYQLCAAAGEVPATKLLGTSAKGFNATGEGDESIYHESLESLQNGYLTPFLRFHYKLLCKSLGINEVVNPKWPAMDAPTELERAQTEAAENTAGAAAVSSGAVDISEERARLNAKEGGMYSGLLGDDAPDDLGADDGDQATY